MEEIWTVPEPVLDHFVDGRIFRTLTLMFFSRREFLLAKMLLEPVWTFLSPSVLTYMLTLQTTLQTT